MNPVFGLIALVLLIPLVLISGVFIAITAKILRSGGSKESRLQAQEESRTIQQLYNGLAKMEERIESLETLLLDKKNKEEKNE